MRRISKKCETRLIKILHKEVNRQSTYKLLSRLWNPPLFIQVVLGPRKVGNTTEVLQIKDSWAGVPLYYSADTEFVPSAEWLRGQWPKAGALKQPALLIIDEILAVPACSSAVICIG